MSRTQLHITLQQPCSSYNMTEQASSTLRKCQYCTLSFKPQGHATHERYCRQWQNRQLNPPTTAGPSHDNTDPVPQPIPVGDALQTIVQRQWDGGVYFLVLLSRSPIPLTNNTLGICTIVICALDIASGREPVARPQTPIRNIQQNQDEGPIEGI